MNKMLITLLLFISFVFIPNNSKAYYDCSKYGVWAYATIDGYCKCMSGYVMGSFLGQSYCISAEQSCKDQYGYGATSDYLTNKCKCRYDYTWDTSYSKTECVLCSTKYGYGATGSSDGGCECRSGYSFGKDMFGNVKCVSDDSLCQDSYGSNSEYDSYSDKCKCRSGYSFGDDIYGETKCISDSTLCQNNYGYNSRYNSLSDKCECGYGYEFTLKTSGGLECKRCSDKYGYYSTYNAVEKKCECMDGYTLDDESQCVKKQNNVYFKLIELDSYNNKALIKSEYDNKYYSVEYKSGCYSSSFNRYLNKQIVVNLGTDFNVDKGDKIVLQEDEETCEISSFEKVDSDFSFIKKESVVFIAPMTINNKNVINTALTNKLKGKILLQTESHGEAWYVNPKDGKRYYMANGEKAYDIMRNFGIGITNKDLNKIINNETTAKKYSGKIFIQVENNGEAYYIDFVGKAHYLKDGQAAYEAMRSLGLGITNDNLYKIAESSL